MNSVEHLESHLGRLERGWKSDSASGLQVCLFRNQPVTDVVTLATLGLANSVLKMSTRTVRQELLMSIRATDDSLERLAKLLVHVAERIQNAGHALLRGEVIRFASPLTAGSSLRAFYASIPILFSDTFATLADTHPPTVFVWLIPVSATEAEFVESSGWDAFEDRLESAGPDLFDPFRKSVIVQ